MIRWVRALVAQYDESEKRREFAKNSLERYTHYYERWASNVTVGDWARSGTGRQQKWK